MECTQCMLKCFLRIQTVKAVICSVFWRDFQELVIICCLCLQVPARINRLVFLDTLILDPWETAAFNSINQPGQALLSVLGGYPFWPIPLNANNFNNPIALLDVLIWKSILLSDTDNMTLVLDTYSKVRTRKWYVSTMQFCYRVGECNDLISSRYKSEHNLQLSSGQV